MADSLRKAAEAVIDECAMLPVYANTPSSWNRGIRNVWEKAEKLKAALSAPDPVAEAREILKRADAILGSIKWDKSSIRNDIELWLERNGDTE